MASVYILFSKQLNLFYTGSCKEIQFRIIQHLENIYKHNFSAKADDWKLFFTIDDLDYRQERNIEKHIKKMKSSQYIADLKKHHEIVWKLKIRFSNTEI